MQFSQLAAMLVTLSTGTQALLNFTSADSLNRYIPGESPRAIAATLETDPQGFIQVGEDGVMRSVSGNGSVIDFHQLDPSQLEVFALSQLHAWNASTLDVPDDVQELAKPPFNDGRLVLDKTKLLHPDGIPASFGRRTTRSENSAVMDRLRGLDKRQDCIGKPCEVFHQCASYRPTPCYACYYPRGPIGMCMLE